MPVTLLMKSVLKPLVPEQIDFLIADRESWTFYLIFCDFVFTLLCTLEGINTLDTASCSGSRRHTQGRYRPSVSNSSCLQSSIQYSLGLTSWLWLDTSSQCNLAVCPLRTALGPLSIPDLSNTWRVEWSPYKTFRSSPLLFFLTPSLMYQLYNVIYRRNKPRKVK